MSPNACDRWSRLSDRRALAEPLELAELHFLDEHPTACDGCRAEQTAWSLLAASLADPSRLEQPAVPGAAERAERFFRSRGTRRRRWVAASAVAALAVAAASALWLGRSDEAARSAPLAVKSRVRVAMVSGDVEAGSRSAAAEMELAESDAVRVRDGRACVSLDPAVVTCLAEQSDLRVGRATTAERSLFLSGGHLLAKLGPQPRGTTFRVETAHGSVIAKGTVFAVDLRDPESPTVRVHEGTVVVRRSDGVERTLGAPAEMGLRGAAESQSIGETGAERDEVLIRRAGLLSTAASCKLEVNATPAGARVLLDGHDLGAAPVTALVTGGRRLSVEHPGYAPLSERVSLLEKAHVVRNYELVPLPSEAGAALPVSAKPAAESEAAPSAPELLSRARAARAAGRYREAESAYRRLLAAHPKSDEAQASWVSLGELELSELGNPGAALRAFDAYLKGGGKLKQEARYGRVRALGRLGRREEERRAIEHFLRDYPDSVQASSLRQKLASP